jgi:hypothetical protein
MKATITLGAFLVLAAAAFVAEPAAMAVWSGASREAVHTPETAVLVLSGASLRMAANLVRRYGP